MAMASPSKQRNKRVDGESGVPRRVTRSQSREVEERRVDYEETRLRKTAGRDSDDGEFYLFCIFIWIFLLLVDELMTSQLDGVGWWW